jgi:hypothetical protein
MGSCDSECSPDKKIVAPIEIVKVNSKEIGQGDLNESGIGIDPFNHSFDSALVGPKKSLRSGAGQKRHYQ